MTPISVVTNTIPNKLSLNYLVTKRIFSRTQNVLKSGTQNPKVRLFPSWRKWLNVYLPHKARFSHFRLAADNGSPKIHSFCDEIRKNLILI